MFRLMSLAVIGALFMAACENSDERPGRTSTVPSPTQAVAEPAPGSQGVTLRGTLTLDGVPINAEFAGARVVQNGLSAACQNSIPPVHGGRYELPVASAAQVRGCGEAGAQIILWVYTDRLLYSNEAIPWMASGGAAEFDATFSSDTPLGAAKPVTGLKGRLFAADGTALRGGTVIEAFVGDTLCGATSLRPGDVTEGIYALFVAGPDAVPGCEEGAEITFRLDGQPAAESATNDLDKGANDGRELNLTLK